MEYPKEIFRSKLLIIEVKMLTNKFLLKCSHMEKPKKLTNF